VRFRIHANFSFIVNPVTAPHQYHVTFKSTPLIPPLT
jgi:hypothetical protein